MMRRTKIVATLGPATDNPDTIAEIIKTELILGGCLTSVYNDGGQVEIVTNPALRYHSVEDAVEKWDAVLRDEDLASRLLQEQLDSRSHLTRERFLQEFDKVARLCLERGVTGAIHELIQNETTPVPV